MGCIDLFDNSFVEEEEKALKLFANTKFLPYRDLQSSTRQKGFVKDLFEKSLTISMTTLFFFYKNTRLKIAKKLRTS